MVLQVKMTKKESRSSYVHCINTVYDNTFDLWDKQNYPYYFENITYVTEKAAGYIWLSTRSTRIELVF